MTAAMDDVRAVLLAGGLGTRMGQLTADRLKPLVPFGGQCRLVDFSLANARNSGLNQVLLLSYHNERQLIDYLRQTWSEPDFRVHFGPHDGLVRQGGSLAGLASRPPERGTADALLNNADYIFTDQYRDVLVLHSDHVYRYGYGRMLAHHRSSCAALTIGYRAVPPEQVKLFGMVRFNADGWLTDFVEKPTEPRSNLIFTAFCFFDRIVLASYLNQLQRTQWSHDISRDLIPAMLANRERIAGVYIASHWEDIGTVPNYRRAHLRLLCRHPTMDLRDIPCTLQPSVPRRMFRAVPGLRNVLCAVDLVNDGSIQSSVVYPGVRVGSAARVRHSVLLPGSRIADGVSLERAVVLDGEKITSEGRGN